MPQQGTVSMQSGGGMQFNDAGPNDGSGAQRLDLDEIVERVIDKIEQRVVDELERRGRRFSPGVF